MLARSSVARRRRGRRGVGQVAEAVVVARGAACPVVTSTHQSSPRAPKRVPNVSPEFSVNAAGRPPRARGHERRPRGPLIGFRRLPQEPGIRERLRREIEVHDDELAAVGRAHRRGACPLEEREHRALPSGENAAAHRGDEVAQAGSRDVRAAREIEEPHRAVYLRGPPTSTELARPRVRRGRCRPIRGCRRRRELSPRCRSSGRSSRSPGRRRRAEPACGLRTRTPSGRRAAGRVVRGASRDEVGSFCPSVTESVAPPWDRRRPWTRRSCARGPCCRPGSRPCP